MTNMIHSFKNKANVSILKSSFCFPPAFFFLLSLLSIGKVHAIDNYHRNESELTARIKS